MRVGLIAFGVIVREKTERHLNLISIKINRRKNIKWQK